MLILPTVIAAFFVISTFGVPVQHARRGLHLAPGQWAQLSVPVQDAIKSLFLMDAPNPKASITALETVISAAQSSDHAPERLVSTLALKTWEGDLQKLISNAKTPPAATKAAIDEMETWTKLKMTYKFDPNTPASEILKAQPAKAPEILPPKGSPATSPETPKSGVVRFGSTRMKPGVSGSQQIGTYLNQLNGQNKQAIADAIDKLGLDKLGLGGSRHTNRAASLDELD